MTTFSAFVDKLVIETSRPDRRASLADNTNSVIRELHFKNLPGSGAGVRYSDNLVEEYFTPTTTPVIWPITRPNLFMGLEAIYDPIRSIHFTERHPRNIRSLESDLEAMAIYYRTGAAYTLGGALSGVELLVAYYEFLPALKYVIPPLRQIEDNDSAGYVWSGVGTSLEEGLALETNWMLDRHESVIREGVLSKHYRVLNDLERARMFYSSYETMRAGVQLQEATG